MRMSQQGTEQKTTTIERMKNNINSNIDDSCPEKQANTMELKHRRKELAMKKPSSGSINGGKRATKHNVDHQAMNGLSSKRAVKLLSNYGIALPSKALYVVRCTHTVQGYDEPIEEVIILDIDYPSSTEKIDEVYLRTLRSKYRGVSIHPSLHKWRSRRKHGSVCTHLGYFTSDLAATVAYYMTADKNRLRNQDLQFAMASKRIVYDETFSTPVLNSVICVSTQNVLYDGDSVESSIMQNASNEYNPANQMDNEYQQDSMSMGFAGEFDNNSASYAYQGSSDPFFTSMDDLILNYYQESGFPQMPSMLDSRENIPDFGATNGFPMKNDSQFYGMQQYQTMYYVNNGSSDDDSLLL